VGYEAEDGGDAGQAIVLGDAAHEAPCESDEPGMAGQRETETVKGGAAGSRTVEQDPRGALGQAGSSSRPSRRLLRTAGSMSRTQRA
jgi:hypothetical protein